ncbi:MAG: phenylalanine--tRNA ligase subunit beta [Alphaproteobacteria bacterium]|nr:phenylalanine--tRNA ligase subunit beta [Alphaproteobacteria bacterium]
MKFTLSWLKDHLDTTASLADISRTLTAIGLEVEDVVDPASKLAAFTVAKIVSAERHPEADKLQVCRVASDAGELQIVCGAANARAGLTVVLAKEGTVIPGNGMVIKKTKIRGVESNGMLCSLEELGLANSSEGIVELPDSAAVGSNAAQALGANDPIIEIAITPNRADCLGVRGVARDLATAGIGTLKPLKNSSYVGSFASPVSVSITTENCQQFIGTYIKGVKNGASPEWMKKRLEAIGQKSISVLVDITNYVTFDLGRPLHVYDAKKLSGNLTVRAANEGEKFAALNDKEYILRGGMCVIADNAGVQALGGIMGGANTSVDENTTDVFLEVALFAPVHVAENGRTLQIDSDARYRFERGVDVAFVEQGAKQALSLITELCGGQASELVYTGSAPEYKRDISFDATRVKTLGGVDISSEKCFSILEALGFEISGSNITPPSWRADVEGEADLVEEILRIHGYDNIPPTPLPKLSTISRPALTLAQKRVQTAKRVLASQGMMEVVSWSFLPEAWADAFGGAKPELKLLNPISADLATMRPCLLPNLLEAARKNSARGFANLGLFEVGLQFKDISPEGQRMVVGGIRTGSNNTANHNNALFGNTARSIDAFDAKTDALALLSSLGVAKCDITTDTPPWYHPGRSGALVQGKNVLGYFGELHPALLSMFDLEGRVAVFEIFLDAIPTPRAKGKSKSALKVSDYQAVERDFAFLVGGAVTAATMEKAIRQADKVLITDVRIFDVYVGKGVDEGKKSVAIKVTLQAMDRTLSEADLTAASNAIIKAAASFGGTLRG